MEQTAGDGTGPKVDAYTGATTPGIAVGAKFSQPVLRHRASAGLDLFSSGQAFTYKNNPDGYAGQRKLTSWHVRVPLCWHFCLWDDKAALSLGMSAGWSFVGVEDNGTHLPAYSVSNFSLGPVVGLQLRPFSLANHARLGIHAQLFRSAALLYQDTYNQEGNEGTGTSYIKAGVSYYFPFEKEK